MNQIKKFPVFIYYPHPPHEIVINYQNFRYFLTWRIRMDNCSRLCKLSVKFNFWIASNFKFNFWLNGLGLDPNTSSQTWESASATAGSDNNACPGPYSWSLTEFPLSFLTIWEVSFLMEFQLNYFKSWKMMLWTESAALNMPANLENSAGATGLEKVSFHSNPKERQCQRMFKLLHSCIHLIC